MPKMHITIYLIWSKSLAVEASIIIFRLILKDSILVEVILSIVILWISRNATNIKKKFILNLLDIMKTFQQELVKAKSIKSSKDNSSGSYSV